MIRNIAGLDCGIGKQKPSNKKALGMSAGTD
jgi:hypothetical protein